MGYINLRRISVISFVVFGLLIVRKYDSDYRGNSFLFRLVIPSISFDMKVYNLDNDLNNVDYNIEMLDYSNLENNLYFIAGHSGNGDNCYFNKIKDINIGEYVYIISDDSKLVYRVVDRYYIVKNGYMEVNGDEENYIYLITCDIYNNNRQLILEGILVNNV